MWIFKHRGVVKMDKFQQAVARKIKSFLFLVSKSLGRRMHFPPAMKGAQMAVCARPTFLIPGCQYVAGVE
jgi:hypothetical protein